MIKERFTISKISDKSFRFCGLDITLKEDGSITVSMEDYANSLQKIPIDRKRDKDEVTTYQENSDLRGAIGKLGWLAANVRPDLSFAALRLQKTVNNSTVKDIKYANKQIERAKQRRNKIRYVCVGQLEDLVVYGIGDASFTAGQGKQSAIGGQWVVLGTKNSTKVSNLLWKSRTIRQVCKAPKDSETINACLVCDKARHLANQLSDLLFGKEGKRITVIIFTDSLGTLESIASSKQVDRNLMRQHVYTLQQHAETGEVQSFNWTQDENMIADVLTKDIKYKEGLDDLLLRNKLKSIITRDNSVSYQSGEFRISGRKLREKLAPKANSPIKRKIKKSTNNTEEEENPEVANTSESEVE